MASAVENASAAYSGTTAAPPEYFNQRFAVADRERQGATRPLLPRTAGVGSHPGFLFVACHLDHLPDNGHESETSRLSLVRTGGL